MAKIQDTSIPGPESSLLVLANVLQCSPKLRCFHMRSYGHLCGIAVCNVYVINLIRVTTLLLYQSHYMWGLSSARLL